MERMKLSWLLGLGFGAVVLVMIFVAVIGYMGITGSYSSFVEYRTLATTTNIAGRIQANMLEMRLGALKFSQSGDQKLVSGVKENHDTLVEIINQTKKELTDRPREITIFEDLIESADAYYDAFNSIDELLSKRNETLSKEINPTGEMMVQKANDIMNSAYKDSDATAAYYTGQLIEVLMQGRLSTNIYVSSRSESDYTNALEAYQTKLVERIKVVRANLENPRRVQLLNEIEDLRQKYLISLEQLHQFSQQWNNTFSQKLDVIGPKVSNEVEKLKLSLKDHQDKLGVEVQSQTQNNITFISLSTLASIVIGVLVSMYINRQVQRPIGGEPTEIAGIVKKIADGNLQHTFSKKADGTGIYRSIHEMTDKLKQLIGEVIHISSDLSNSAKQANDASAAASSTIHTQQNKTLSISTAMNEMAYSIQGVVENAAESASLSKDGLEKADNGKNTATSTINEINALAENLQEAVKVIKSLEKSSSEIGSVIDVIQSISEQTNLLALNAAIEAARAGEQGRGFAVVADEVRTLAQRTGESTTEIQNMVSALQNGTLDAVNVMEKSFSQAANTVEKSRDIADALEQIHNTITLISDKNIQVATAVEQQSAVADEIARNIEDINVGFDATADNAKNTAITSGQVSELASSLKTQISGFRV